ncbi:arginine-glutamic acid dipeptide repeats protein-like isoform X2 [Trichogramma pretiosum]|uniref:arginine-glutamic acid dipeptide repeats protein-like isoform X2 n=1 Tax=Trichogramma pretiosum TaxID=7493 RepID=UPI000C71BD26|nr:arginine-glutamic acid dipeptide repeats protein-like isoform X2 [Trichogramma pretiosum]
MRSAYQCVCPCERRYNILALPHTHTHTHTHTHIYLCINVVESAQYLGRRSPGTPIIAHKLLLRTLVFGTSGGSGGSCGTRFVSRVVVVVSAAISCLITQCIRNNEHFFCVPIVEHKKRVYRCKVCHKKFHHRRNLQNHVYIHLKIPYIVLKRVPYTYQPAFKTQAAENYSLNVEHPGDLKIKLKRTDSLKLTLRKSPLGTEFSVVSPVDPAKEEIQEESKLAQEHMNDKNDSEEEKTSNHSGENEVFLETNHTSNEDIDSEPEQNPLESIEQPSMDNNEGDSGVGSDSINPSEKEDENVEDVVADHNSNSNQAEAAENDDIEESDAIEATCRETIENLKMLGEHSRLISSRSQLEEEPIVTVIQEKDKDDEIELSDTLKELQRHCEISIVPKSALMKEKTNTSVSHEAETEIRPIGTSSSVSWTALTEDARSQSPQVSCEKTSGAQKSIETPSSMLQNFLNEHERNKAESNANNQIQETEYVSLEKLAEKVNVCKVCNEKFKDTAHLETHKIKAGHFQCKQTDCRSLLFKTSAELSSHVSLHHRISSVSPNVSNNSSPHHVSRNSPHSISPQLNTNSPLLNTHSPSTNSQSPHLNTHSPHLNTQSPHLNTQSPHSPVMTALTSPMNSPVPNLPASSSFNTQPAPTYAPISMDQLPAPVQQLAQQVQRMPLPQSQMSTPMMNAQNYYPPPPSHAGRPPIYRAAMHYASQMMYPFSYPPMGMQPQMQQHVPRPRYQVPMQQRNRAPVAMPQMPQMPQMSQMPSGIRPRMKRPPPQGIPLQAQQAPSAPKQRRMDVLLPDRNEDADCHVIAQQKRNNGLPVIQNVQGGNNSQQQQTNRPDPTIHLTDSITLSVRQPGSNPEQVNAMLQNAKRSDTAVVTDALTARGITVTPAGKKNLEQTNQAQTQAQAQPQPQRQSIDVSSLNLSPAISIVPAQKKQPEKQQQQVQFAVPQSKQAAKPTSNEVERPPRPPTVDLTQDVTPIVPPVKRGRPPSSRPLVCQFCDKRFPSQEILNQHMTTHSRTANKLQHRCNICQALYPDAKALNSHRRLYHNKDLDPTIPPSQNGSVELAIPVVDMKSPNSLSRLSQLGIQSYIPLSQLSAQTGGFYGLPIVTIDGARNAGAGSLAALGATSILSLGPLKQINYNR